MSAGTFEYLVTNAFGPENPVTDQILKQNLYETFVEAENRHRDQQKRPDEALSLAFERLRLGIGAALMQACARLSENPEAGKVVELLLKALKAKNIAEIDKTMHDGVEVFENLYTEVFVNNDRERIMALFEQVLEVETRAQLNAVLRDSLEAIDEVDWEPNND